MKPVAIEKTRFQQDRAAKHEADMAAQLTDPGKSTMMSDTQQVPTPSALSPELLNELSSAASMIMGREECEALLREIADLRRSHPVAA